MRSVLRQAVPVIALTISSLLFSSCSGSSNVSGSSATTHVLTASAASLVFGSQTLNTTIAQGVVITNTGTGSVQVQNVMLSGSNAFDVRGFTGAITLPPSQSLNLTINFTPIASTSYAGTLAVSASDGAGMMVALSGSGTPVAVTISPSAATMPTGLTQQFTATVTGSSNTGVTWSATGGTISSSGVYAPPNIAGSYVVTASSVADPTKSASATVTVTSPPLVAVTISPTSTLLPTNSTQQFTASVTGVTNGGVNWLVNGVVGGDSAYGTISATGFYTAPATAPSGGAVSVTAQSAADRTKAASASVTIATVYSNIDDSTTLDPGGGAYGWGWCGDPACAGGGSTATQKMYWGQQPSLDGGSTQFMVSGSAWADALWWYKVGANDNVSNFQFDFWLNVSQAATSYSHALEFDMYQFSSPTEYMFGTECNYGQGYTNGTWDIWNQSTVQWVHTSFACPAFVPGDWYHITWNFNRTSDQYEHYKSVTIQHYDSTGTSQLDSSNASVNMTLPSGPLPSGWGNVLGVNFQLDINCVPGSTGTATYTTLVDEVTLTVW